MQDALWVFGYGSLIWDPGFPVAERRLARASGWRRSFCMWSIHHRGSEADPGLVLALDRDAHGRCDGLALRVAPGAEEAALAGLRARELISSAYLEAEVMLSPDLRALTYVINRDHVQYCGGLDPERQAQVIAAARGGRGENCDYLYATVAHLAELGIADPELERLAARVRAIRAENRGKEAKDDE